ncbi:MAG: hypothetical protein ACTSO6_06710 [Promethearchaeota archaeon]
MVNQVRPLEYEKKEKYVELKPLSKEDKEDKEDKEEYEIFTPEWYAGLGKEEKEEYEIFTPEWYAEGNSKKKNKKQVGISGIDIGCWEAISLIKPSKSIVEQKPLKEEPSKQKIKEVTSSEIPEKIEKPLPTKIEAPQPKLLSCTFCGMEIDVERNFCQRCGQKLKKL